MCSSCGSRPRRRAVTILEVLLAVVIFLVALVPVADLFTVSNRVTAGAARMLDATVYAQRMLERIAQLEPDDLPQGGQDSWTLAADGVVEPGESPRWPSVAPALAKPPPFPMESRDVTAKKLPGGAVAVKVKLAFLRIAGEKDTEQELLVQTLVAPRSWR